MVIIRVDEGQITPVSTITVTMRYAHADLATKRAAVETVTALVTVW